MAPSRGFAIVESEVAVLTMALKRGQIWSRSTESLHPTLLQAFLDLKRSLARMNFETGIRDIDPNLFLTPFLDVIRSEVVTGPVTGMALTSISKFLSYNLISEEQPNIAHAVEHLADAVTHARLALIELFVIQAETLYFKY